MPAHNYVDTAPVTELAAAFASPSNPTLQVVSATGFPAVPYYISLGRDTATEQIVEVTAATGTTLTVTHVSGSTGTHGAGTTVEHVVPARFYTNTEAFTEANPGLAAEQTTQNNRLTALETATADTGWTTSGFTVASGWTSTYMRGRKMAGVNYVEGFVTRTGGTLTSTSGNVADTSLMTIPAAYYPPTNDVPVYMQHSLSGAGGRILTNGTVQLMTAGRDILNTETIFFLAIYPAT